MSEYVLAIHREELTKQNIGTDGLYPVDFSKVDQTAFAWLPRHIADAKDRETKKTSAAAVELGKHFPQILGYFQITDEDDRILTYFRKGKEKGLVGMRSIGVGGHVDLIDGIRLTEDREPVHLTDIVELIRLGAQRELAEEIDLSIHIDPAKFTQVISSVADPTSAVHVGLAVTINISDSAKEKLTLAENEFMNVAWLTKEELKEAAKVTPFETWSALLIERF